MGLMGSAAKKGPIPTGWRRSENGREYTSKTLEIGYKSKWTDMS